MSSSASWARAALLSAALSLGCLGATPAVAQSRVPTVTRLVKQFIGLEDDLSAALRSGDAATIDRLVAEDFEQREAAHPGEPLPRVDWLQHDPKASGPFADITQMAVHEHGDVLVVSFMRSDEGHKHNQFVVDVWKRQPDGAKLLTRYLSAAPAEPPSSGPAIKKKY